jgi:type IV pilus assembly protein PilA
VGLIVAMLGTLGVLGVLGARKYLKSALTNESKNTLGQIAKDAAEAHERSRIVCPSATRPVPADISLIRARKYPSTRGDWEVDKARNAGFACLDFEMTAPQYYQYRYEATATSFLAGARGDLDGDGDLANFTITGEVRDGRLVVSPSIEETDPAE